MRVKLDKYNKPLAVATLIGLVYFVARVIIEFYISVPLSGTWLGKFSIKWGASFVGLILFCVAICVTGVLINFFFNKIQPVLAGLTRQRQRMGWLRWILMVMACTFPAIIFLFSMWGNIFTGAYLRLLLLLVASILAAIFSTNSDTDLVEPRRLAISLMLTSSIYVIAWHLQDITNYPFSLTWSEGNRFFDYSVYANRQNYLYEGDLSDLYNAPGRYLLWGILFFIPNVPIWLHRLWDGILWTVPYLVLGYILARRSKMDRMDQWIFSLWVLLFLTQGPIYAPLVLSAILVVALVKRGRWWLNIIVVALAGFYASASRWTWLPAAATWAALLLLPGPETSEAGSPKGWKYWKSLFLSLFPVAIVGIVGLAGGALANSKMLSPRKISGSTSMAQPLLWERLLPNATFNQGIIPGLLIATGALIALGIWLVISKKWRLTWVQQLAYLGSSLAFLAIGIVASVKIGGGSNLHNLDMFLVTISIFASLAWSAKSDRQTCQWPWYARIFLALCLLVPAWNAVQAGTPLLLPTQDTVDKALNSVVKNINNAKDQGEVLFIDNRQLFAFGYIKDVPLIPEYEKKYMMDQAMANNEAYFKNFYRDLRNHRFKIIVVEPLHRNLQGSAYSFPEENNAWVTWVSRPLLCYYTPAVTIPEVRIQILSPRSNTEDCP